MEIIGMSLEELEAHSDVQLLPDRIEMHRGHRHRKRVRRVRAGNINCTSVAFGLAAGEDAEAEAENADQICIRVGNVG
jgi:phage head maturation protease